MTILYKILKLYPYLHVWYLKGCVVPIHVSMEDDVLRVETTYADVQRASKGQDASTVSFNSHLMNIYHNEHLP